MGAVAVHFGIAESANNLNPAHLSTGHSPLMKCADWAGLLHQHPATTRRRLSGEPLCLADSTYDAASVSCATRNDAEQPSIGGSLAINNKETIDC